MKKKNLKYSIIIVLILVVSIASLSVLLNKKNISMFNIFGRNQTIFSGENTETENGENYTYSTNGDASANYVGGDTSGKKSEWIKNGNVWTYTFYVDDPNAQWYIWEDTETLMEGYTGDYTENNIGTIFTEETITEFTPNNEMSRKVDNDGKTVYTWLDSENAYKVTDNGNGTYTKVTTKLSFTITNTKQGVEVPEEPVVEKGSLSLKKIVKNSDGDILTENDDNTNFQFTVTLSAGTANSELIEGTKIFGNIVFKNKQAKIALKAGKSITIPDLPEGVTYNIVEGEYSEYETSYDGQSGTIVKDIESIATITNVKKKTPQEIDNPNNPDNPDDPDDPNDPEQKYVDITIKKIITGNNEINEEYTIEMELNNLKSNKTYELSDGKTFKSDSEGSANVTIKLSHDQSVILKNIPVGAKYKAFEYAGDYISSYVITDSNNKGLIANTANRNAKTNVALTTATETADEGENVTITFTNKKIVTENLKLTKTVTDEEDENSYMFDIEFGNMEEGSSFNSTVGRIIAEEDGKAEVSVNLANGESVEFYEIPVGTTYRVKELASSSIASYTIIDKNGLNKIEKESDSNTKAKKALITEIETVNQGEDVTINFINNTVNQEPDSVEVGLGVTKNVQNNNGEIVENCADAFDFEIIANNAENKENYPMPEETNVKITGNGTESFGTITFTETGTYTYKVTEKVGYSEDYEYDNSEYIITFEVTSPEGLLEVSQTIKKKGLNSDAIIFTNKTDKYEEKEPDEPENPDEPTNPENPEEPENPENPDEPDNQDESDNQDEPEKPITPEDSKNIEDKNTNQNKEEKKEQKDIGKLPQTGQTRIIYITVIAIIVICTLGIVFMKIKSKK